MDLEKGGRRAIERMVEAYGFTTRQALCDQLGVNKGTLANRYMRDSFPADWVIQCALETGASLRWLTTGLGVRFEHLRTDIIEISKKKIVEGKLYDAGFLVFDKVFLPEGLLRPFALIDNTVTYVGDEEFKDIVDGKWLVEIEATASIRDLVRMPGGKVRVEGGKFTFDCLLSDLNIIASMKSITKKL
ncbi:phage repressor protein CI [Rahnella aceris]